MRFAMVEEIWDQIHEVFQVRVTKGGKTSDTKISFEDTLNSLSVENWVIRSASHAYDSQGNSVRTVYLQK